MKTSIIPPEHEHYRSMAASYDERLSAILPMSEIFFSVVLSFIPESTLTLLELGSGTGYATARVVQTHPGISIHGIDHAPEMIRCARMKPELAEVSFYEQDIRDPWPESAYDVILTTLCLHHIPRHDRMILLSRIQGSLSPGGIFICGDIIRPETDHAEEIYRTRWIGSMKNAGMSLPEIEEITGSRNANYEEMETIQSFPAKMKDAGFSRVLMPYRYEISAVFVGYR